MTTPNPITQTPSYDPLQTTHISTRPQKPIEIIDPNPTWPHTFTLISQRIQSALGPTLLSIEHVGSTSVPSLPAKDVIDIDILVEDPSAEESYIPALEALGFQFLIREEHWHRHRLLGLEDPYVNLHVFGPESLEAIRHRLFRDWLRSHPEDRDLYAKAKREAAAESRAMGETVMQYNDRKEPVIRDILRRVYEANGMLE
ncbi:GrpB domain protein [Aspergillus steynii IBT 23096]|uniref:GrpB domain protein n=1 Tax=Aspergillus steynii IBT 23096 TaxID=1392250 RepID=A0A2I2GRT5_9EURO|nr:GrpB domain protein [Aspergillus steynii IBT 23096]PLB55591.1 GrpB domain protein [Aspergillus steynii IBT 23096]